MKKANILNLMSIVFLLSSCNNNTSSGSVSNISNSNSSSDGELLILNVKQFLGYSPVKIQVYINNINVENLDLYYEIIDESICKIEEGYVSGLKIGKTDVYASTINGQEYKFTVSIKDPIEYRFNIEVNSIEEAYRLKGEIKNPTLFIGDSFFDDRNFWHSFYDDFTDSQNVFSAGVSSSQSTDWLLFRHRLIYNFNPKNVIIHIGTNDINDGSSQLSVDQYYQQIITFLDTICKDLPNTPIYFFGIENRTVSSGYGAKNIYVEKVTAKIKDEFSLLYNNFIYIDSPSIYNQDQAKYISNDGIHPSNAGYEYYVKILNQLVTF